MANSSQNDVEDWLSFLEGNETSFIKIYEKYYQDLFRFGMRISYDSDLTKDCIQDMFSNLWNKRNTLTEVQYVKAYLFKYVSRLLNNQIQKNIKSKIKAKELLQHAELIFDFESNLISETSQFDKSKNLHEALTKLTKRQREIIKLKFFEGFDYEEIIEITGLKQKTIYNIAHEAINALKKTILFAFVLTINTL